MTEDIATECALTIQPQHANRLSLVAVNASASTSSSSSSSSIATILSRLRELHPHEQSISLSSCLLASTPSSSPICIARGLHLFIVNASGGLTGSKSSSRAIASSSSSSSSSRFLDSYGQIAIRTYDEPPPTGALIRADTITALCWIQLPNDATSAASATSIASPSSSAAAAAAASSSTSEPILFVGFNTGIIRAYRATGQLLFTQRMQHSSIRTIRVRRSRPNRGMLVPTIVSASSQAQLELLIVYESGIAWVDGRSLATSLREAIAAPSSITRSSDSSDPGADLLASSSAYPWSFRVWTTSQAVEDLYAFEALADADPFLLPTATSRIASTTASPTFVCVGLEPALALYTPRDDDDDLNQSPNGTSLSRSRHSTRGAIKLVASKLTSAVFTMAKTWWHSDSSASATAATSASDEMTESIPDPEEIDVDRCIRDTNRQVVTITGEDGSDAASSTIAPTEQYALIADNLGRVCLFDLSSFVLVRMWKGYRDAQCCLIRQHYAQPAAAAASTTASTSSAPASKSSSVSTASTISLSTTAKPPKSKKGRLAITQRIEHDEEEDDPLRDFDSSSSTPSHASLATSSAVSSIPSSSPATLSTRVPSSVRTVAPLYMVLYAPRRGQLELWSLPYGARIGARHIGMNCRLLPNGTLIRADGRIQTIQVDAPTRPVVEAPTQPEDEIAAADANLVHDTQQAIQSWMNDHAITCKGYACDSRANELRPILAPLTQLASALKERASTPNASEWSTSKLDEEHVARVVKLLQVSALQLWNSCSSDVSVVLCPRLCESVLQSVDTLLTAVIELAAPDETHVTEIRFDEADQETTVTITHAANSTKHDAHVAQSSNRRSGWILRASSPVLLSAKQLKQTVSIWLHILAAYHTACAPAGKSASANVSMTLVQFLDCFRVRVDIDAAPVASSSSKLSSKISPAATPRAESSSGHVKKISSDSDSSPPDVTCNVRLGLNSTLTAALAPSAAASAPPSALTSLASLLFGSAHELQISEYIASNTLDLLSHLYSAAFERNLLTRIFCVGWWRELDERVVEVILTDDSQWSIVREQVQLLFLTLIQVHGRTNLSYTVNFLSSILSWCYYSPHLIHVSSLLRLTRSFCVKPQLEDAQTKAKDYDDKVHDGDIIVAPLSASSSPPVTEGDRLKRALAILTLIDVSTRILFRHLCQLRLVRANFPARAVPDHVLTLQRFVSSHPLSRLVLMHLLHSNSNQTHVFTKDDIRTKLHSFESILASAGDLGTVESSTSEHTISVSSLLAVRTRLVDSTPGTAAIRAQMVGLPISSWDWKLTSDESSCYIYASLLSLQRFLQSSHRANGGITSYLVAAISYLEYAPLSAMSGGLAVHMWKEILAPILCAFVHAAYPDPTSPTERPVSAVSKSSSSASASLSTSADPKKAPAPPTFLKLLKSLAPSSPSSSLIDTSDLESLRSYFLVAQRALAYLSSCFSRELADEEWEGSSNYFCPAIAQTLDVHVQHAIPTRLADQIMFDQQHKSGFNSIQVVDASGTTDRYLSALVDPSDGPPAPSNVASVCTSLFHTHVRYTHPESSDTYANIPSPLYSSLTRIYALTDIDNSMSDLMRLVEVMSAHVELDLSISLLASINSSIGHLFPAHPYVKEASAFKCLIPKQLSIFPRLIDSNQDIDVIEWISKGTQMIEFPPTPKPALPSASPASRITPSQPSIVSLPVVPIASARLSFLMSILKERSALSTASTVFSLIDVLSLPPPFIEALLREHILLLYERGEDSRAWECVPKLDDDVCMATVLIGVGRTRLGLFLHSLESKHAAKYAQLVAAVPAQAWQWLAKAKPPHIMTKRENEEEKGGAVTVPAAAAAATKTKSSTVSAVSASLSTTVAVPPTSSSAASSYVLSGSPEASASSSSPLRLILHRTIQIKQRAHDIDIHATLTLLKRARAILDMKATRENSATAQTTSAGASSSSSTPSTSASAAASSVLGDPFGRDGDNNDALRPTQPIRYARAYAAQMVEVCAMVIKGIGGRTGVEVRAY